MPKLYRDATTARHETPDVAELRRLAEAATPGPWSTAAFQLVIDVARRIDVGMCGHRDDAAFIAAANPATVLALLDERDALLDAAARLAHMTEARNNARAEVKRLTAKLDAIEADGDKLSIMFGWLVYDVGEHTCGGYGPESGYAHEPGCGFEPVLRLDKLEGWPGEKPLDGRADS